MTDIPIRTNAVVVYPVRHTARGAEVLLLKRSKGDALDEFWLHCAGRIEKGEKAWQAARRELQEETGLTTDKFYSANFCEQFYSAGMDAICILPLFVAVVDEAAEVKLNHEHSGHAWVSFDKARQMVPFHNQRQCLDVVEEYFVNRTPSEFSRIKAGNP
jgi:dATP pyrophosphohydrolase